MTSSTSYAAGDLRFYEDKYPEVDQLVIVRVNRIIDMGVYVTLLEYNHMEGMILMSELSKRRFRSVNKLIRVGRTEVVMVLRIDKEKGYIDLSKRRVAPEDITKAEEKYCRAKKVQQTVRNVAENFKLKVEFLNKQIIWPLEAKFGDALDALKEMASNPAEVQKYCSEVPEGVMEKLIESVKLRLSPSALKFRARVDVRCLGCEGVDAVKRALSEGECAAHVKAADIAKAKGIEVEEGKPACDLKIKLIAPPKYVAVASNFDRDEGLQILQACLDTVEKSMQECDKGEYRLVEKIAVLGGEEDQALEEMLKQQREAEEESSGSDEEEEDVEGMGCAEDFPDSDEAADDKKKTDG